MTSALLCVAMAIYFEARGEEQVEGRIAIAEVIENRVKDPRFPSDSCAVVRQGRYWDGVPIVGQCQFTFYCDGKAEIINDYKSWLVALYIASQSLNGELATVTGGATHYHSKSVDPYWSHTGELTQVIGSHLFYKL
jgi:spore germination cell wall hydrolase CwlJ-like protein